MLTKVALNSSAMRVRRRGAESTCNDVREVEVATENHSGNQVTLIQHNRHGFKYITDLHCSVTICCSMREL